MIDLGSILTEPTSVADVLRGATTVTLGGREYDVPARSIEGDEQWVAGLDGQLRGLLAAVEDAGNDTTRILSVLGAFPDELIGALKAYDDTDVLPSREDIKRTARSAELLIAVAKVWRLANPLAAIAVAGLARQRAMDQTNGTPSGPTTSLPNGSARRSRRSAKD